MIWIWCGLIVVLGITLALMWVYIRGPAKGEDVCCYQSVGDPVSHTLEGVSAFGDVVEVCRHCGCRVVYERSGKSVRRVIFTPDDWRSLRGKVPAEGFHSAQRLTERARRSRSTPFEREASGGEWE